MLCLCVLLCECVRCAYCFSPTKSDHYHFECTLPWLVYFSEERFQPATICMANAAISARTIHSYLVSWGRHHERARASHFSTFVH